MNTRNTIEAIDLRVEYLTNPLGIDTVSPRLSWIMEAGKRRNVVQSAYRIIASTSLDLLTEELADLWDSGVVTTANSQHIKYAGRPLVSGQQVYWKVRIWDEQEESSEWSEAATFSMGLLSRTDWKGCWIGLKSGLIPEREKPNPAVYLRKTLLLNKPVKRAAIYATALGVYRIYLNGDQLGPQLLAPEWTDYHVRTQYQTYDITESLLSAEQGQGANEDSEQEFVLSIVLGHGWYTGYLGMYGFQKYGMEPSFFLQGNIEFTDGTNLSLSSDESWHASFGPVRATDLQMGEIYDAAYEMPGWQQPQYTDNNWQSAERMYDYRGQLVAQMVQPVMEVREYPIASLQQLPNGNWLVDIGQNLTGWLALHVPMEAEQTITVRYAEALDEQGMLYTDNLRLALQTDQFKADQPGMYYFETLFTCHGFQYAEISGLTKNLSIDQLTCKNVYSNLRETGSLTTSHTLVNKLVQNIMWSQRNNYISVPTDCPQRDERHGWTGDAQIFARTAAYNMDIAAFMTKWMYDLEDGQQPTGAYSDFAPFVFGPKTAYGNDFTYTHIGSAGWADAPVMISWLMYEVYGDTDILGRHYNSLKRWMNYNERLYPSGIRCDAPQYGDWLSIHERPLEEARAEFGWLVANNSSTPYDVFSTLYWAYDAKLMISIAKHAGQEEDALYYEQLFYYITEAFHRNFVSDNGIIKGDTQSVYAMALDFGILANKELENKALLRLVHKIEVAGNTAATGFHGTRSLMRVLSKFGYDELAFSLLLREQYPSWLYSVVNGATTIWERWDGWTNEHGFQNPGMNSLCHYAFGSVGEWLYEQVGGIRCGAEAGFKHIIIAPKPLGGLSTATANYQSTYGRIAVAWSLEEEVQQGYTNQQDISLQETDQAAYPIKQQNSISRFSLIVEIPANTTADIHIPVGNPASITEGGQPIVSGDGILLQEVNNNVVIYRVGSGHYHFQAKL